LNFALDRARGAEAERDAYKPDAERLVPLLTALRGMDWIQVILNQAPPCCMIESGKHTSRFCGRAERWAGHPADHPYVSLGAAIDAARSRLEEL
jgi:hypothetical protein